jgi:hypothetical protein
MPNIHEILLSLSGVSDQTRQEIQELLKPKETDSIPAQIINWHRSGLTLDSANGQEVIRMASSEITALLMQNQGRLGNAFPAISKIMECLIPPNRAGLSLVFGFIEPIAVAVFCSRKMEDALEFLSWCAVQQDVTAFTESGNNLRMNAFGDALAKHIADGSDTWMYFIREVPLFRTRSSVIQAICEYCDIRTVLELAELPLLPKDNTSGVYIRIFTECGGWSSDALMKLCALFSGKLTRIRDFGVISEVFVAGFESLPLVLRAYFEDEFKMVACPVIAGIIADLEKSGKNGSSEFCRGIRNAWLAVNDGQKTVVPDISIDDDVML